LDPRHYEQTAYGFAKTGVFRVRFLLESLINLRESLQRLGSDLVFCTGIPEEVIPVYAQSWRVSGVYYHEEVGTEEKKVEHALKKALQGSSITCHSFWGHTLLHPEDLPFSLRHLPEVFTDFRKAVESSVMPRPLFPSPLAMPPLPPGLPLGIIKDPPDFLQDPRQLISFRGGETAALNRIQSYVWEQDRLRVYKETRNGMLDPNDSSKLSPWLALGCISPRYVYYEVQRYEAQRIQNESTYWLIFELLWRDYFRLIMAKHGDRLFRASGLQGIPIPWKTDPDLFQAWKSGTTGYPLVDANMQELWATGFMSNRGRQNVASFLTKNLGLDWRQGAAWFESCLIDYDVCSNWGNWNYTAGVGNDARGFRYFNIPKQSRDYDPQGSYLKHWLPVLQRIRGDKIHEPYTLTLSEQNAMGIQIGTDYPAPIVNLNESLRQTEKIYLTATQSLQPSRKGSRSPSKRRR
jgi:deoxyribodipyrimidine photo-lyase